MNFLSKYATLFKWLGGILVVAAISFAIWDYGKVKEQNQNLEDKTEQLANSINSINDSIDKQKNELNELRIDNKEVNDLYRYAIGEIRNLESKTDKEVIENKDDIQKEINRMNQNLTNDLLCETGDTSKCEQ